MNIYFILGNRFKVVNNVRDLGVIFQQNLILEYCSILWIPSGLTESLECIMT